MNFDEKLDFSKVDLINLQCGQMDIKQSQYSYKEVTENLEKFELGIALQKVYEFIWDEFCDWYIELVKPRLYDREVIKA